jgi:choline-sulfatase
VTARLIRITSLTAVALALLTPRPAPAPHHLVIVSLDTLRADHLGTYGYEKPTSPVFDRLARQGVLFTRAVAQGPSTLPSHGALMTGQYHSSYETSPPSGVPGQIDTLAEVLARHGFATWAFTDGGYLARVFGLGQGFTYYADQRVGLQELIKRIDHRLPRDPRQRTFLFVHCYDVHTQYHADASDRAAVGAQPWRGKINVGATERDALERERPALGPDGVAPLVSLYDADIHRADRLLDDLLDVLAGHGVLNDAVVVLLSDHGEEFFEHGRTQHKQLYLHPNLHVPLLWLVPGRAPARIDIPVELIDVLPTALELLGLPRDPQAMGRSLVPLMDGAAAESAVGAYSEGAGYTDSLRSLVTERYQLLYETRSGTARLNDYVADPGARHDLAASEPDLTARLVAEVKRRMALAAERRASVMEQQKAIDATTRRELQALGYAE